MAGYVVKGTHRNLTCPNCHHDYFQEVQERMCWQPFVVAVEDGEGDPEYDSFDWADDVKVLHFECRSCLSEVDFSDDWSEVKLANMRVTLTPEDRALLADMLKHTLEHNEETDQLRRLHSVMS